MDCATAMTLLAIGSICLTMMFVIVAHYVLKQSTEENADLALVNELDGGGGGGGDGGGAATTTTTRKSLDVNALRPNIIEYQMRRLCERYAKV